MARSFKLLVGFVFLACLAQWAPAAGQSAAPDAPADKLLALTVDAPAAPLVWGDEVEVTLVASNPGPETVEAVSLFRPPARGLVWLDGEQPGAPWLELGDLAAGESRTIAARLRVEGIPASGLLRAPVMLHGRDAKPARARLDLRVPGPAAETAGMPAAGGEARLAGGRVRFAFPPGWHDRDARLDFQLQELYRQPAGEAGRLLLFAVEATDGAPIDAFAAPVQVELQLGDLLDQAAAVERLPVVSTRRSESERWTPVESTYDPATGVLRFAVEHFSTFQATTEPQPWKLAYNPPGASPYTGAATYAYPIELPPGIGGLTPDLTLSYSSRSADGAGYPAMGQGFGAGWAMPQPRIHNGNAGYMYVPLCGAAGCEDFQLTRFTLVLGGVSYYLTPVQAPDGRHGTYKALGGPELKVEYLIEKEDDDFGLVSQEYWRVRTADGVTYTFGATEASEQVIGRVATNRNSGQPANDHFAPVNWMLDSIQDLHGNVVSFGYATACGQNGDGTTREWYLDGGVVKECSEVDVALSSVSYNGGQTTAVVTYAGLNDRLRKEDSYMLVGHFRPTQIEVKQGGTTVGKDVFTYETNAHYRSEKAYSSQFWLLTNIAHTGVGGAPLPGQTFIYDQPVYNGCGDNGSGGTACVDALTRVYNNYGAVTAIDYTMVEKWLVVSLLRTWDGVGAVYGSGSPAQQVAYDRTGYGYCKDTAAARCHIGGADNASDALVGFDGVVTQVKDGGGTVLSQSATRFYNDDDDNTGSPPDPMLIDDYWRIGKVKRHEQRTSNTTTALTRDEYRWVQTNGDDQLAWEKHTTFDGATALTAETVYTYDNAAYGALVKKEEKDETGAAYRCTTYAYAHKTDTTWLVNRPLRETVLAPGCGGTKQAETLYRYADSDFPADTTLDGRALLTWVLRWEGSVSNRYAFEKRTYTAGGLPEAVITYETTLAANAQSYAGTEHNRITTYYNALGLPEQIGRSGGDVATENSGLTYDTTLPWLVASVTDANGIVTGYAYDAFGRLTKVVAPGDSLAAPTATTTYSDGPAPWKVETTYKNTIRSAERTYYDGLGRVAQTQVDNANVHGVGDKDVVTSVAYDARGLEVCRTAPYFVAAANDAFHTAACSAKANTTTAYDALGRATSVTTPDGATTAMTYGVATTITVDTHSRFLRTSVYDGNDHVVNRFTDVFGRLVLVREFTGNSTATYSPYADTRYHYDELGNLTKVWASAASDGATATVLRETTMGYDALGRKTSMTDQDMGVWGYGYGGAGNLIRQQSPAGVLCFYYDDLNRLTRRVKDDSPTDACPSSPPASGTNHLASYTYGTDSGAANNLGKPLTVSWGTSPAANNDAFTYDGEGRPAKQTRLVNGRSFAYEMTAYDTLDRPTQVKLYDDTVAETIDYAYDHEGAQTLTAGGTPLIDNVGYNERGQLVFLGRPGAPDTTLTYHGAGANFGRLSLIGHGTNSDGYPDYNYNTYDAAGNLTGMVVINANAGTYSFGYDEMNRLTTAALAGAGTANYSYTYTYNRLGNLMSRAGTDPDMTYAYGAGSAGPQAVTSVSQNVGGNLTYTYDPSGNLATRKNGSTTTHIYTFDVENRLTSVQTGNQTMSFAYDADGQRVLTTRHDGTLVYTPFPDYEREVAGGGAVTTRTTYRIAGQIVAVRSAGTLYYTYGDHLGNIAALSSTTGVLDTTSLARYDPFGNFRTTPATNPDTTNHGFTGHVHNNTGVYPTQNVGLIYMNARYYLPEVGRFISPDSIVPEPGNAQSYNRYSYSYNNPVKFSDPSGHCGAEVVASNDDPTVGYDEVATCLQLRSELESILGHPVLGIWYLWQMRAMHEGGFALADQGIILKLPYLPNRRYALEQLAVYWAGTNITSLEISARVVEFAAAMGASIEDLIAVLSGHGGDGIGRPGGRTLPSPKGPYSSEDALKDRSSGFNEKYGDPDPSNNQVHHTWYWIQVAYYNADITAYIGNLLHEAGDGAGKSVQDYRAGVWGIQVGTRLQKGQLSLVDLAMKLRVDLGN